MNSHQFHRREFLATGFAVPFTSVAGSMLFADDSSNVLTVVVMDPLAAPLSCDCVKGYAQRKYERLAISLKQSLSMPIKLVWSDSLEDALKEKTKGKVDLVIGKHSVVLADAKKVKRSLKPIASLTGKDGKVTQTGLIVVRAKDAAKSVSDLKGYSFFLGTEECEEKSAAPVALLAKHGIKVPSNAKRCDACSTAAKDLLKLGPDIKAAAVISSYAQPLLQGCGTIQKGDLRVVGETKAVPFVTAFVNTNLPEKFQQNIQNSLIEAGTNPRFLIDLETESGFVAYQDLKKPAPSDSNQTAKKK